MKIIQNLFRSKKDSFKNFSHLIPKERRKIFRRTSTGKVIFNEFKLYGKTYYFKYTNREGIQSERIIKLTTVCIYANNCIKISGYDTNKNDIRRFNLDFANDLQDEELTAIKDPKNYFLLLIRDLTPSKTGEVEAF
jgi:hypothetical protein